MSNNRAGRSNSTRRRARKTWILNTFGNGNTVFCNWCKKRLTFTTLTIDRYPIPGARGGRYREDNIVPACKSCNNKLDDHSS